MAKISRHICLSKELDDLVDRMHKEEGFNLSEFVSKKLTEEFMNKEYNEKRILNYQQKIEELKNRVLQQQEKFENISEEEKKFILEVPSMIKKGFELMALKNRFNIEFGKDLFLKEFKDMVKKFGGKEYASYILKDRIF